jgi:predicted nucleic acid-binding protein
MKFLVDSDFWFGLMVEDDAHHTRVLARYRECQKIQAEFCALKLVIFETATVLSNKINQQRSLLFLDRFYSLPVTQLDLTPEMEECAWQIFRKQTKKGTSFVDCANMAAIEKYKFDGILSFDEFYPKELVFGK